MNVGSTGQREIRIEDELRQVAAGQPGEIGGEVDERALPALRRRSG